MPLNFLIIHKQFILCENTDFSIRLTIPIIHETKHTRLVIRPCVMVRVRVLPAKSAYAFAAHNLRVRSTRLQMARPSRLSIWIESGADAHVYMSPTA